MKLNYILVYTMFSAASPKPYISTLAESKNWKYLLPLKHMHYSAL